MTFRDQLIDYTQSLFTITPSLLETRYRLLPSLRGRLVWMIRSAVAAIAISTLILLGTRARNFIPGGTSLIPIGAMLCLMNNFGSTNIQAYRAITGGAIGAGFSIAIAGIFAPLNDNNGNGALLAIVLVFIFLFVYFVTLTNTSVVFKRVSMSLTIVGLLLLYQDPRMQGVILNLYDWAGVSIGVAIAICCTLLPLPIIDNATREMALRLRINNVSLQSRLGGLVIAFTHKTEIYRPPLDPRIASPSPFPLRRKHSRSLLDDELEFIQETNELEEYDDAKLTSRTHEILPSISVKAPPVQPTVPLNEPSTMDRTGSGSSLSSSSSSVTSNSSSTVPLESTYPVTFWSTTERAPLLRADIIDLQDNGNYSLPVFSRLLADMKWELIYYLPFLPSIGQRFLSLLRCRCRRTSDTALPTVSAAKGFFYQASVWTKAWARFHRVIGVMIIAELTLRSSPFHSRFIDTMGEELCECVLALTMYMTYAIEQSTSFSIDRTVPKDSIINRSVCFRPIRWFMYGYLYLWGLPIESWNLHPYRNSMDDPGINSEDTNYPSSQLLSRARHRLKQSVEKVFRAYQNGRLQLYENLKLSTTPQPPSVTLRSHLQHRIDWHSEDLLALNTFVFTILRCCQIVLTAADETCYHTQSGTTYIPSVPIAHHRNHGSPSTNVSPPPPNTNFMSGGEEYNYLVPPPTGIHPERSKPTNRISVLRRPQNIRQIMHHTLRYIERGWRYMIASLIRFLRWLGIFPTDTTLPSFDLRASFSYMVFQSIRASKVAAGVTLAAGLAVALENIFGANVYYWAPITAAFLVGSADGGAWRTSILRLQGTLAGAIFGYLVILIANQSEAVMIVLLTIWTALMTYPRAQPQRSYWSLVSTLTAFVIVLGLGPDTASVDAIALGRVKQTILGILSYLFISNVYFPISARTICKQRLIYALHETRTSTGATIEQFIRVVETQAKYYTASLHKNRNHRRRKSLMRKNLASRRVLFTEQGANDASSTVFTMEPPINTTNKLPDVDETLTSLMADLLDEAAIEPALWRSQFIKSRYTQMIHSIRRTLRGISIIQQCTMSLFSEAEEQQYLARKLHQQWPMMLSQRRLSTFTTLLPTETSGSTEPDPSHNLPYQLEGLPPTAFLYESRSAVPVGTMIPPVLDTNVSDHLIIHMHITGKAMREYTPVLPYLIKLQKSLDETFRLVLIIMNYGYNEMSIVSLIAPSGSRTVTVPAPVPLPTENTTTTTKPSVIVPPSIVETKAEPHTRTKEEISSEAIMHESFIVGSTGTTITEAIEITEPLRSTEGSTVTEIEHKTSRRIITTTTTEPTGTIMLPFLPSVIREIPYRTTKIVYNGVWKFVRFCGRYCCRRFRTGTTALPSISIPRTVQAVPLSSLSSTATTPNGPEADFTTSKHVSPIDQYHSEALNQLPIVVENLLQNLVEYKQAYDTLLHKAVSNVPVRHENSNTTTTNTYSASPSPWIDISPLDAICFNTASFAITEISEAVMDIARLSRRIRDN